MWRRTFLRPTGGGKKLFSSPYAEAKPSIRIREIEKGLSCQREIVSIWRISYYPPYENVLSSDQGQPFSLLFIPHTVINPLLQQVLRRIPAFHSSLTIQCHIRCSHS